ncbi:hypothetical protein BGX23_000258 [Mortierella sp. AD031]|nr:hypothetical protein BGX23_000258 [Mortierella sp. AD031]
MSTTKPYDQQQHQQQQQGGYTTRSRSASVLLSHKSNGSIGSNGSYSASSSNLGVVVPAGRPLPMTPGMPSQQPYQQQYFDPSSDTSGGNAQYSSSNSSNNNNNNNNRNNNGTVGPSSRSGRVSIHISHPSNASLASVSAINIPSNNNNNVGTASRGHASWVQPKANSSASTSFSNTTTSNTASSTSGAAYSTSSTLLTKTSQQHLHHQNQQQQPTQSQGPKLTQEEVSSYYAALTRPISPTMIMNYISPPLTNSSTTPTTTTAQGGSGGSSNVESPGGGGQLMMSTPTTSSLRPLSATAALSSSFSTLGPGSQPTARPALHQGARSSYMEPSNPPPPASSSTSNQTPKQDRPLSAGGSSIISAISGSSAEDQSLNSSRFARRGPLVMSHENGSVGDVGDGGGNYTSGYNNYTSGGTRSRRASDAWSDTDNGTPVHNLYRQSFQQTPQQHQQHQQQPFSPATPRADTSNVASAANYSTFGMQHLFPIKTIDMAECFEVQVKAQDARGSGRFEFKLVTRKEESWFATDTMSERTGWIDALNSLMSKAVGASLLKLEAKLNNIRHRNNSLEYSTHADKTGATSNTTGALEGHLQLVQQDLATREQQLSQREQELERKRIGSLLVQLEAWRAAAKVTVNQHYAVRDQLLERVMKTARTVQELLERARIHLETGSDQIAEVVNSHLECIRVHASESSLSAASYKMIKSILVGLSVNLDTRSSEMKRVLLVMDQYIHANRSSNPGSATNSSPASPRLVGARERRMSVGGPLPPPMSTSTPPSALGIGMYLVQVRNKYSETLEILEDHSRRLKRILERADINNPESARRFQEDVKETLKSLLRHPSYVFTPCLPDQTLPGAADTFYREDLVVIQQTSKELLRKSQVASTSTSPLPAANPTTRSSRPHSADQDDSVDSDNDNNDSREGSRSTSKQANLRSPSPKEPTTISPAESQSTGRTATLSPSPPTVSSTVGSSDVPKLNLALPASLSSFLLSDTLPPSSSVAAAASTTTTVAPTFSSTELTQKLRDTILPEFDHLSIKQEESLQSMTTLLNQVSSALVKKLVEIKDATAGQRQEFEELKDEIIDVMQLSATDPSAHQRDISALSEIRSKLADITAQLAKVQTAQQQLQPQSVGGGAQGYYGAGGVSGYRRVDGASPSSGSGTSAATATGFSLLQRSASTMVHNSSGGAHPFYHAVDSGSRRHLHRVNSTTLHNRAQIPSSASMVASLGGGGGLSILASSAGNNNTTGPGATGSKHSKIAGMTRLFEESDPWTGHHSAASAGGTQHPTDGGYLLQDVDYDSTSGRQNQQVAAKLDQLLLLLEFVNTAQCRMMAYQDLEYDRHRSGGGSGNVDDGRMMAVQEHMEQMDRKMNLQMHLLRHLASAQTSGVPLSTDVTTAATTTARIKEIDVDNGSEETPAVAVTLADNKDVLATGSDLEASIESIFRTAPPENELTLLEILGRLDLQVIPSVKDQSERIRELSDQLSEMKRQLDEQHKRQELLQLQQGSSVNATSRPRSAGSASNIGRSNSVERPVTPLLHSRSPSQTLFQQQQHQQSAPTSSLSSPLEPESPALWRASLRPSHSNGSNSASFRDRFMSASNVSPLPTTPSSASLSFSQISLQDSAHSLTVGGGHGTLVTKTSDRIAELLDMMDSKMGQVIDEQLARYEKGNKALLAKVFELLEADEDSEKGDSEMKAASSSENMVDRTAKGATTAASVNQQDDQEVGLQSENNALLKEINRSLQEDKVISEESKQTLERILRGQEELLKTTTNNTRHRNTSKDDVEGQDLDDTKDSDTRAWKDSLDRIKTLIQHEGDRSEASMSDQRDEILDKMNQVLSSIQDSQTQFGSRDSQVREELQELRDWMVRHASQQTESLRELVLSASTPTHGRTASRVSRTARGAEGVDDEDERDFVERGSDSKLKVRDGDGEEEEYTEVDILEDLDRHHHQHKIVGASAAHPIAAAFAPAPPTPYSVLSKAQSTEIKELKEQLEMFTKIQMATFSEMADNVSGVEKMMRDMSKMMGVRRGGTILRRKEAEEGRAMLAMEVKETIQEVIGRMSSTGNLVGAASGDGTGSRRSSVDNGIVGVSESRRIPSVTTSTPPVSASTAGAPSRGESGLFKYLYQARRSTSLTSTDGGATSAPVPVPTAPIVVAVSPRVDVTAAPRKSFRSAPTSPVVGTPSLVPGELHTFDEHDSGVGMTTMQIQMQLDMHQDQIEQLYKRKVRAEIEVEDLQAEKARLLDEKVALREEVEQLRRERQELLLLSNSIGSGRQVHDDDDGVEVKEVSVSSTSLLEKMLQDRVSLLLQETARLEEHKRQLERETRR